MIEVIIKENEILAIDNEKLVGKLEFSLSNKKMSILHTFAYESGKGVGSLLIKTAMNWAEKNQYTIIPICSFAKKFIQ